MPIENRSKVEMTACSAALGFGADWEGVAMADRKEGGVYIAEDGTSGVSS
jgi:hypothetical protein